MVFRDKNETLQPPEGYDPLDVQASGSFLRLVYRQLVYATRVPDNGKREGEQVFLGTNIAVLYLNDMGREVMRTVQFTAEPSMPGAISSVPRWYRFKNGFYIALEGLQEMMRWRKNSSVKS